MMRVMFLVFSIVVTGLVAADIEIVAKGLFKGGAILIINGQQHMLKVGKTSPEGVKLLRANTTEALIEIDGKRKTLTLSERIGGSYTAPEKKEVRISRGPRDHYLTPGRINGRQVNLMIDTGASSVVLNSTMAKSLGINYRVGREIGVATASGTTRGYQVVLQSVAVGTIKINNVTGIVLEGDHPIEILLGNTYLSRIDFKVDSGVLVLQAKY